MSDTCLAVPARPTHDELHSARWGIGSSSSTAIAELRVYARTWMLELRSGTERDVSAAQDLERAARTRYLGIESLAFVAAAPPIAAERVRSGDLIVAEQDGMMLGFVLLDIVDERLHITNISVAPTASGRGVGAALIAETMAKAQAIRVEAVTLTTFRSPPWNVPWFERFGFERMPEEEIGAGLHQIRQRQAKSVDATTRATLWLKI